MQNLCKKNMFVSMTTENCKKSMTNALAPTMSLIELRTTDPAFPLTKVVAVGDFVENNKQSEFHWLKLFLPFHFRGTDFDKRHNAKLEGIYYADEIFRVIGATARIIANSKGFCFV